MAYNDTGGYHRGQNYDKKYFSKRIVLAQLILHKLRNSLFTKQIPWHVLLQNRDKSVAATLQRKCSGAINFVIITKIITKIIALVFGGRTL